MKRARRAATEPPPLRVAVVGAGSIGSEKAVEHFGHATNTVVTVVVDAHAPAAEQLARTLGSTVRHATQLTPEILAACDMVYVAAPPQSHKLLALRALAADCHVLLEKPIAASSTDGEEIVAAAQAAERRGVYLGMNIGMRWNGAITELRRRLHREAVTLLSGQLRLHFVRWPRTWQQRAAWVAYRSEGGPLREVGTHFFFAIQELFGTTCVRRVRARLAYADESASEQGQLLAETSADGVLELSNGLAIELSLRTDGGLAGGEEDVTELRFEFASGDAREELVLEDFTRLVHRKVGAPGSRASASKTIVGDGGYGETESISSLVALARREEPSGGKPISAVEGRNAQRLLDAITASEGEWVEVKYE